MKTGEGDWEESEETRGGEGTPAALDFIDAAVASGSVVTVPGVVPQAEYMYGCMATAAGMLLGYYDLNGYQGGDFSRLIDGVVDPMSRGTDGDKYDMDAFDTALGRAIASEWYVSLFFGRTEAEEAPYAFVDDSRQQLNTQYYDCIAAWMGTGIYNRGGEDFATIVYLNVTLDKLRNGYPQEALQDGVCGLALYVENQGYALDGQATRTVYVDGYSGGTFTFEDYMAEIDAGRPVLIHIEGHAMLGYGYDREQEQVILDDCYDNERRLTWNGSYNYAGRDRELYAVTTIVLEENVSLPPPVPHLNTTLPTNQDVVVTFSVLEGLLYFASFDGVTWQPCSEGQITVSENGTLWLRCEDQAGRRSEIASVVIDNIDRVPPQAPAVAAALSEDRRALDVTMQWDQEDARCFYSLDDGLHWLEYGDPLALTRNATLRLKTVDPAGNETPGQPVAFQVALSPGDFTVSSEAPWEMSYAWQNAEIAQWASSYDVRLSWNGRQVFFSDLAEGGLEVWHPAAGNIAVSVRPEKLDAWSSPGEAAVALETERERGPLRFQARENGLADFFAARVAECWSGEYRARHQGGYGGWNGTGEICALEGKNKIADLFLGSGDSSLLVLTDEANGDALFLDDLFTEFPLAVANPQARFAQLNEIRAGDGDDLVDGTSRRFACTGAEMTIRGGAGNDVIWANAARNWLFGDAGDDRLVGAAGNDVLIGGIGNDSLHGGGGEDFFCFCGNFGTDTVEQLADGMVTLWFAEGNRQNWNPETLTYESGGDSVVVRGVDFSRIVLKFGAEEPSMYRELLAAGAFDAFSSDRIFEEMSRGALASA